MANEKYRRLIVVLLLGFSSGLPLALTGTLLQAWFTVGGASITAIGFLSLIGQPYVYKFIWAPFLDYYVPPLFGRRRGWLIITQLGLVIAIACMALGNPMNHPYILSSMALAVAIISATQDIAVDAYRTDILPPEERGIGSALYTGGFRFAMMASGGLGLVAAQFIGWRTTYLIMAGLMIIGLFATWFGEEPAMKGVKPPSLIASTIESLREFLQRDSAIIFLLMIVLYKLGDAISVSLTTTFLIRDLGFSLATVGAVAKSVGLLGTLLGVFIAGILMLRISLYRALMLFGILQTIAILTFLQLAISGQSYYLLVICTFTDNLFNAMGTTALVALLMSLCDHRYTAAQFALLTAISSIARVFVGPLAGYLVEHFGWVNFFIISMIMTIPGLLLLSYLRPQINAQTTMPAYQLNAKNI